MPPRRRYTRAGGAATATPAVRRPPRVFNRPDPYGRFVKGKNSISNVFPNFLKNAPFRPRRKAKMVYQASDALTVGATNVMGSIKEFCLNSLYDPDKSGAGHQPYGYDQMATIYNAYKVSGCLVELDFIDPSEDSMVVGIMLTNPTGTSATIAGLTAETVGEKQMGKIAYVSNTGRRRTKMKFYVPLNEMFNLTREQYRTDVDNTSSLTTGSPASSVDLQVAVSNIRGDGTGTVVCNTRLTYYCTFYDRIVLSQS